MSINSIFDLYKTMERNHAMLSFKGLVTADLLDSVLRITESKLDHIEKSTKRRKKVYNILVECLQNLYHHNESVIKHGDNSKEIMSNSSILCISNPEDYYEIKTGNYISKEKAEDLELKIKNINKLDKEELRELYKSVLSKGQFSSKGTAGLGLIDIARKSGNKLEYSFMPIDKNYSFFCLNVKIK
ncbi:SiaB family protein kinase [Brumimicrobium glaciale]|nr:SiaB family protein kinase [Brumimicrobium glaciale]